MCFLTGAIRNHRLRATLATQMFDMGIPEKLSRRDAGISNAGKVSGPVIFYNVLVGSQSHSNTLNNPHACFTPLPVLLECRL